MQVKLKYGFCKKSLRKNATLNSWTLFSSQKGTCTQNPYFRYLKVLKRGRGVVENTTDVIYGRPLSWLRFPTTLKAIDWTSKVLSTPSFLMYPISVNSFDPPLNSFHSLVRKVLKFSLHKRKIIATIFKIFYILKIQKK